MNRLSFVVCDNGGDQLRRVTLGCIVGRKVLFGCSDALMSEYRLYRFKICAVVGKERTAGVAKTMELQVSQAAAFFIFTAYLGGRIQTYHVSNLIGKYEALLTPLGAGVSFLLALFGLPLQQNPCG